MKSDLLQIETREFRVISRVILLLWVKKYKKKKKKTQIS